MSLVNISIVAVWLVAFIGLPLSIFLEFQDNNLWLLYFKLYPHMILFPLLFFGIVTIALYQAFALIKNKQKLIRNKWLIVCITIFLSITLLTIEITSNNIMLFEIKSTAQSTVNVPREVIDNINKVPTNIFNIGKNISGDKITINKLDIEKAFSQFIKQQSQLSRYEKQSYYKLMQLSLSYQTWEKQYNNFSLSRRLYEISFFLITSASIMSWIMLFLYSSTEVNHPYSYIKKLAISSVFFIIWIPLRFYYNLVSKNVLFGEKMAIGHFDVFAFIVYPIYFFFLCLRIYKLRRDWYTILFISIFVILLTLIGRFKPDWISLIFGLNSNPIIWIIILILEMLYCLYQLNYISFNRS